MKTVSFGIADYCVACRAHCRYCLLDSCGKTSGVDFAEGTEFAGRVLGEMQAARADIPSYFYIGYCMDTPYLKDFIRFSRKYHSPAAGFLQMNGFAFRNESELRQLTEEIYEEGVEMIDLTFFGMREYHDRFAGRKGDFDLLVGMLDAALKTGLKVNISIPLIRENLGQMNELRNCLEDKGAETYSCFLPHSKGRGNSVQEQRITKEEFEQLPVRIRSTFQKAKHQTEAEWLAGGELPRSEKRNLSLVLNKDNIAHFSSMSASEILDELEAMDDRFISEMPSVEELAERYGRKDNRQLYKFRDLVLRWRQEFIAENGKKIFDMHDETHHFSVHIY